MEVREAGVHYVDDHNAVDRSAVTTTSTNNSAGELLRTCKGRAKIK